MPRCVKCDKYFHPDFSVLLKPDTEDKSCKCVFCYTEKKEVTVSGEDGKPDYTVSKREAEENYRVYVAKLKEDPKVSKVLAGKPKSKFEI